MVSDKLRNKARTRYFPLQYNKSDITIYSLSKSKLEK